MASPRKPAANGFVRQLRKVYNPLGFSKGYNFVLFFIFAGALMGFTLARFQYLKINGGFCGGPPGNGAAPGECYCNLYYVGIIIHLGTVLPAMFLACFQFVPAIRYKFLIFHRINGYVIIVLSIVANVGALMVARRAFGGFLSTQVGVGVLVIATTFGLGNALYNIKRLQVEQHRAWMLRTFFYFGSIITLRLIMIITALIISPMRAYYSVMSCATILYILGDEATYAAYPLCTPSPTNSSPTEIHIPVVADFGGNEAEIGASLDVPFGVALWLALALHAVGVELYLRLTPREHERLRQVSYVKQLEAGLKNPGGAGLVVQRVGDAEPWVPRGEKVVEQKEKEKEKDGEGTSL
ncbi:MAG: hypothetical protein M1817_004357 [Caeruleum heppii]|nr:MAG: hypothetical protein M1817_004357 [Caeruleum heppii]